MNIQWAGKCTANGWKTIGQCSSSRDLCTVSHGLLNLKSRASLTSTTDWVWGWNCCLKIALIAAPDSWLSISSLSLQHSFHSFFQKTCLLWLMVARKTAPSRSYLSGVCALLDDPDWNIKVNIFWCPPNKRVGEWACQSVVPQLESIKEAGFADTAMSLTQSQLDFSTTRKGSVDIMSQTNWSGKNQERNNLLTLYFATSFPIKWKEVALQIQEQPLHCEDFNSKRRIA